MVGGMLLVALGLFVMHGISLHTDYFPRLAIGFFLMGFGDRQLVHADADRSRWQEVPHADAGLGSGIVNVSQQVSGALGLAVLSTFATNHSNSLMASAPRRSTRRCSAATGWPT